MIKYIVFDFDGTLVDSKKVSIDVYNELVALYRFRKIDDTNFEQLKPLSTFERMKALGVPLWMVPLLAAQFFSRYGKRVNEISFVEGMAALVASLSEYSFQLAIVSSNSVKTIQKFLMNKSVAGISKIYCSSKIFGKEKVLRKFLKENKLQSNEVLYVCDELRDIEACRKLNIKTIWVSWGYELKEALKDETLELTADTPEQLMSILEQHHTMH